MGGNGLANGFCAVDAAGRQASRRAGEGRALQNMRARVLPRCLAPSLAGGQVGRRAQEKFTGEKRTFFIIPALRLEKVMWRRDLSWMNLISIFLRSRPGLSSSSSSSSAAARARLTPRFSMPRAPLPSSWTLGDAFWSCSVISLAMVVELAEDWLPAVFGGRGP